MIRIDQIISLVFPGSSLTHLIIAKIAVPPKMKGQKANDTICVCGSIVLAKVKITVNIISNKTISP